MKVFISWSEERSKKAAEVIADWLPQVIQSVEPWISTDIAKGSRSTPEISAELEKSKVGIICLTPENLNNNWILFEAGALSKIKNTKVCTFLLDLTPMDVKEPLSQFQHTIFKKEDFFRLVSTINTQLTESNERSLPDRTLYQVFERSWPEFQLTIEKIIKSSPKQRKHIRSDRDILEELLDILRRLEVNTVDSKITLQATRLFADADKKYKRLIDQFGVDPNEAIRSVIADINQTTPLSLELTKALRTYLEDYWKSE